MRSTLPDRDRAAAVVSRLIVIGAAIALVAGCNSAGVAPTATGRASATPVATASAPARTQAAAKTPGGSGGPSLAPPEATPLADPPAKPASDGTTATIKTELGDITIQLFTKSSPVAAENFINLSEAGYYDGVVFHRIVPGFVIQGGDPTGTGMGDPGYKIPDEPIVGEYARAIVAMARTRAPNSAGSQFFIVLDDEAGRPLESARTYQIFGRVTEGMDVVDKIAAGPRGGQADDEALEPVAMTTVEIARP